MAQHASEHISQQFPDCRGGRPCEQPREWAQEVAPPPAESDVDVGRADVDGLDIEGERSPLAAALPPNTRCGCGGGGPPVVRRILVMSDTDKVLDDGSGQRARGRTVKTQVP